MTHSPMCSRCNLYPETALHCFRDCYFARQVWLQLGLGLHHPYFVASEPVVWIKQLLYHAKFTTLSALWVIWEARNKAVIEQEVLPESHLLRWIAGRRVSLSMRGASTSRCDHRGWCLGWLRLLRLLL